MALAGDEKLTSPHATQSGTPTAELDEEGEDGAPGESDEQAEQRPLAGIAPGLPLMPAEGTAQSQIDAFASAPAPSRKPRTVVDKLNEVAIDKMAAADYPAALDALRRVLNLTPDSPPAHGNLALALWRCKSAPQAEIHCRRALAIDPKYIPAHRILTELLRERNAPDALAGYDRLLSLDPDNIMAHNNRGLLLNKLGRRREADEAFARALELAPGNPHVRFNQLMVQADGDLVEARECCLRALEERPDNPDIMTNLGIVLQFSGRYEEARRQCERVISLAPDHFSARFNLSLLLLLLGEFPRGWEEYENRWHLLETKRPSFAQPEWQGEDLHGKTILLHAEQGFGDTIQQLRYIPAVAARGARIALRIDRPLVRLAASLPGNLIITPTPARPAAFDVWCPLLSLPRILGTRMDSIPADVPYLGVRSGIAERWRQRLSHLAGLKVGLVWAGSPKHVNDFRRSIEVERLKPLFDVAGASFISLQIGERAADVTKLPPGLITDVSAALTDFAETAGAIVNLDLVIAVDTAVVHLAGALAKPTWVMLPFSPDWRWLLEREDSPWYPTLRLYRQPRPGDWESVIARVVADLRERAAAHARSERSAP
jgi:tetratricopeptide (TPR) repeat protein